MKTTFALSLILFAVTSCGSTKSVSQTTSTATHIVNNSDSINSRNQSVFASIAQLDNNAQVRYVAVQRLTNQSVLASIARLDNDVEVRKLAVTRLK